MRFNNLHNFLPLPLLRTAAAGLLLLAVGAAGPARADELKKVDLELLLAVDVSHSISDAEHRLQVRGIAQAFRNPRMAAVIGGLDQGRIAVAVMFWAGEAEQALVVPWQILETAEDAARFADAVGVATTRPWEGVTFTAIGSALLQGATEILGNGIDGTRRVIDVSGDDPSNQGTDTAQARDHVVAKGIVINGLPVLSGRREQEDKERLVRHYETSVAGGDGGFVSPALGFEDFPRAMLAKLLTEITDAEPAVAPAGPRFSTAPTAPGSRQREG